MIQYDQLHLRKGVISMAESKIKATDIIGTLENFYKQVPNLPANAREVLVKIAPAISLIFGVLGVLVGLSALGLSPLALLGGLHSSFVVLLTGIATLVSSILLLMAYPKLAKGKYKGWEYLFWSQSVSVISAVISLSLGSVLGMLIGFYILFQIKSYYK